MFGEASISFNLAIQEFGGGGVRRRCQVFKDVVSLLQALLSWKCLSTVIY